MARLSLKRASCAFAGEQYWAWVTLRYRRFGAHQTQLRSDQTSTQQRLVIYAVSFRTVATSEGISRGSLVGRLSLERRMYSKRAELIPQYKGEFALNVQNDRGRKMPSY